MSVVRPSRRQPFATIVGAIVLIVACGSPAPVTPSPSPSSAAVASNGPSPTGATPPGASGLLTPTPSAGSGTPEPPAGATPTVEPFTPPPEQEPQDDDVCLVLAARADVEGALGLPVGDISAQGTDPNSGLICTYPLASGSGQLLLTTTTEDAASAYDDELDLATTYGQGPIALEGIGDQAFYGAAAAEAPEQVVFTKGPVVARLWNQTEATIGQAAFAGLAATAADAIRAEIPPAP